MLTLGGGPKFIGGAEARGPVYLDYAGIRVTRLAPALRFFTEGLGLVEVRRGKMDHGGVWVLLQDPASQQRLELNWYPRGNRYATPFVSGEGMDHLGVRVSDLKRAGQQIRKSGGRLVDEIREKGKVVLAYYEGPDGFWVELIHSPTL
jgi:catechol 2,3-dioxygenase-like lactoylglutathione lyase family enzyme